jgi:hypothetical protein
VFALLGSNISVSIWNLMLETLINLSCNSEVVLDATSFVFFCNL